MSIYGPRFDARLARDANRSFVDGVFGEIVRRFRRGSSINFDDLQAVVDRDDLSGTNEEFGDGAVTDDRKGDAERQTYKLELLSDVSPPIDHRDTFLIAPTPVHAIADLLAAGKKWGIRRDLGEDAGMRGFRLIQKKGRFTRQPKIRRMQ